MAEQQEDAVLRITSQYVSELRAGGQPKLSEYLARYPQYAEAIADFVAYYHAFEIQEPDDLSASAPLSERSLSLLARFCGEEEPAAPVNALQTLLRTEGQQSLPLSQVAQRIDLSTDIVLLLEQRCIDPMTIPTTVISRLAAVSGHSIDAIRSYFRSTQDAPRHKRLQVAEASKQYYLTKNGPDALLSFKQVVETSEILSLEQKTYWLALLGQEDL